MTETLIPMALEIDFKMKVLKAATEDILAAGTICLMLGNSLVAVIFSLQALFGRVTFNQTLPIIIGTLGSVLTSGVIAVILAKKFDPNDQKYTLLADWKKKLIRLSTPDIIAIGVVLIMLGAFTVSIIASIAVLIGTASISEVENIILITVGGSAITNLIGAILH